MAGTLPSVYVELWALARRAPRRAILRLRRLPAAQRHPAWDAYVMGFALLVRQRPHQAIGYLQRAQALFEADGNTLLPLHCQRWLLSCAQLLDGGVSVKEHWQCLVAAYDAAQSPHDAACASVEHAFLLVFNDQAAEACAILAANTGRILERGTTYDKARLLHVRGVALTYLGRYDEATSTLEDALRGYIRLRSLPDVARCLFDRSWLLQRLEQFDAALNDMERGRRLARRLRLRYLVAAYTKNSGLALVRVGRYGAALSLTLQALRYYTHLQRTVYMLGCQLNLALITHYCGLYDCALAAYQALTRQYEDFGRPGMAAACRRNEAMVWLERDDIERASRLLREAEAPLTAMADPSELAEYAQTVGEVYRRRRYHAQAIAAFRSAQQSFLQCGNQGGAAESCLLEGLELLTLDELDAAERCFQRAQLILAARPFHAWRAVFAQGQVWLRRGQPEAALQAFLAASAQVARLRYSIISEHASSTIFGQARALYRQAMVLAFELGNVEAALTLSEEQRALTLRMRSDRPLMPRLPVTNAVARRPLDVTTIGEMPSHLRVLIETYAALLPPMHAVDDEPRGSIDVFQLARFRQRCAEYYSAWLALVYVLVGDQLGIVVIGPNTLHVRMVTLNERLPQSRRTVGELLRECAHPQRAVWGYGAEQAPAALLFLTDLLLPVVLRDALSPETRLLIVPTADLHLMPWGALPVGQTKLGLAAVLHICPSLTFWQRGQMPEPPKRGMFIGCASFDDPDLPPLAHIEREWRTLQDTSIPFIRLDGDALGGALTVAAVRKASLDGELREANLLHFASHAQFLPGDGSQSHIVLADGVISYTEIVRFDLRGMLVVLSMCMAGAGEVLEGEEILSLSRGFLAAGAAGVVAWVWDVDDGVQPDVMREFYRQLAQTSDPALAVAETQRSWYAQYHDDPALGVPLVWGGFVYTA